MNYKDIKIPTTLNDVKLGQFQRFLAIYEKNKDNEDFLNKKKLEIFCGIDLKTLVELKHSHYEEILTHLDSVLSEPSSLIMKFDMIGTDNKKVKFGFIPNLDKMSYGEFEDLDKYIHEPKNLNRAMAVAFRPIKVERNGSYLLHDYKGSDYLAEVMKEMPLDIALGAKVFFYRLATKLGIYTMDYTLTEVLEQDKVQSPMDLPKSGVLIKGYTNLLKEMSEELTK